MMKTIGCLKTIGCFNAATAPDAAAILMKHIVLFCFCYFPTTILYVLFLFHLRWTNIHIEEEKDKDTGGLLI